MIAPLQPRTGIPVTAALLAVMMVVPAAAQESASSDGGPRLGWGADVQVSTAYIWRGSVDIDEVNTQPSFWLDAGPFTVTSWLSATSDGLQEHDTTIEYGREVGRLSVTGGWINYFYMAPETGRHVNEAFAAFQYEAAIVPSFSVFQPVSGGARYIEGAAETMLPAGHTWSIVPRLTVGYSAAGEQGPASFTHVEQTVALAWSGAAVQIRPFASYLHSLGRPAARQARAYVGVAVSRR